jgi:hypothetical protein
MWGFLMFAGVAWLAISWSVMRLEPTDIVSVAGPVVLFGALTEAVRALAVAKAWWLNAGMAVLFLATGIILMANGDASYTTPAALLGWYLMVRGAADVAVSMMTRETDRIWGLLMVVGVLETGLGFFAASPLSRTADLVVTVLGGLALMRGVADLVAALRLREVSPARAEDLLELPPERAAGVAGYSAGLSDFEAAPAERPGPRHRAASRSLRSTSGSASGMADLSTPGGSATTAGLGGGTFGPGTPTATTHSGWPAGTGAASGIGAPSGAGSASGTAAAGGTGADSGNGAAGGSDVAGGIGGTGVAGGIGGTGVPGGIGGTGVPGGIGGTGVPGGIGGTGVPGGIGAAGGTGAGHGGAINPADTASFHDEVVRTTADLDAMLALAGVTGASLGLAAHHEIPDVPDTPEGVEETATKVKSRAHIPAHHQD